MRSKSIVAAIVIAVGMGTGMSTVVAIPAHADPQEEQLDKAFLNALQQKGVPVKSSKDAIDLAHSTCDLLSRGGSVNDALMHIKNAQSKWTNDQITSFGGVAVQAYCKGQAPK